MIVNVNQMCTVTLRERGVQAYNEFYERLQIEPPAKLDVGGKVTTELWNIMNIFGRSCYMGPEPPFDIEVEISESL